jgi:hypothetical protein
MRAWFLVLRGGFLELSLPYLTPASAFAIVFLSLTLVDAQRSETAVPFHAATRCG